MSGNSNQGWVKKSSPSSKQGPMKATLPMSSLTRQNSKDLKKSKSNSPILSPNSLWKTRTSPDTTPTRVRSPGAFNCKGKCRTLYSTNIDFHQHYLNSATCIRRTASLDTIYLTGQWPRDIHHTSLLQVDKSTQTDDSDARKSHKISDTCLSEDKLEKMIRHRLLQRSTVVLPSGNRGGIQVTQVEHASQTNPLPIPSKQKQPMRSSIEGLNQEIERLVLKAMSSLSTEREEEKLVQTTPEGHRAPLADLFSRSTRSVNTQTPAYSSSQSSEASSRDSGSPLVAGSMDNSRPSSEVQLGVGTGGSSDSSPDQESNTGQLGTSPRINRFLAREPPDGCERVSMKFTEDASGVRGRDLSLFDYCPLKPNVTFQLKPSLGSAFLPLQNITASLQSQQLHEEGSHQQQEQKSCRSNHTFFKGVEQMRS
ncbi:protein FAM117B-like isoform X2 [Lycorma delicatula]|uniref:protein FAM117B-like isoform X2 n=1 Tax=Lycorma delicatula TaxID=130591 RepID=UPI003F517AFB